MLHNWLVVFPISIFVVPTPSTVKSIHDEKLGPIKVWSDKEFDLSKEECVMCEEEMVHVYHKGIFIDLMEAPSSL